MIMDGHDTKSAPSPPSYAQQQPLPSTQQQQQQGYFPPQPQQYPQQAYAAPGQPAFGSPQPQYGAGQPQYAPGQPGQPQYGSPQPQYGAGQPGYGSPAAPPVGSPMYGQPAVVMMGTMGGRVQNLAQFPAPVLCPNCGQTQVSRCTYEAGSYTHIWALVLGLVACCCCIPYMIDGLKDVHHFCSNCNIPLAVWHRSGGLEVLAHQQPGAVPGAYPMQPQVTGAPAPGPPK